MTWRTHQTGWVVGIALVLLTVSATRADEFDNQQQQLAKENPKGVTLKLSLDKQTFSMGEIIPIVIKYSTTVPGYHVFTRNYDRSGRLYNPGFGIDGPAGGWVDPLKDYFNHTYLTGGLAGDVELGEYQQKFELNEWVRFDKPGTYHVYFASNQVFTESLGREAYVTVVSDVVEFKIVETDAKLIQQTLHTASASDPSRGAQLLRYLGTREAVDALVPALAIRSAATQAMFGLISARDRAYAIEALNRAMADPVLAKNEMYLLAQSELSRPLPTTQPSAKP